MADSQLKFKALEGKLYQKLSLGDATYKKELEEIKKMLPDSIVYRNGLKSAIMQLVRRLEEELLPAVIQVARETGCASEEYIYLERELLKLDGKTADVQIAMITKMLKNPLPKDADDSDKRRFYSLCMDIAIASNSAKLIESIINIIEEISKEDE